MAKIIVAVEGDQGSALRTIEVDDEDLTEDEEELHGKIFSGRDG